MTEITAREYAVGLFPRRTKKRDSQWSSCFFSPFRESIQPLFCPIHSRFGKVYGINEPGIVVLSMLQTGCARPEWLIRCCLAQGHTDYSGLTRGKTCLVSDRYKV